jgi:hypothetical protein
MRDFDLRFEVAASCFVLAAAVRLAAADNMAYMGTNAGEFGTLDLDTGVFTILGNSAQTLAGMAVSNGKLYASSYHSGGKLFTVNPANGSTTRVGSQATVTYDDFGSTKSGLYALGTDVKLYSINSQTGAATLIGPTGLTFGSWRSLSTNSDALYFSNGPSLYVLNTSTGTPTLIGNMGGPQVGAMVEEGGKLYAGTDSPTLKVATLNTTTGLAAIGPSLIGSTSPFYAISPFPLPVLGDYNHNGIVDATDYTVWRDSLDATGAGLAADGDGDQAITTADYDIWKANFGHAANAGAGDAATVPEPPSIAIVAAAAVWLLRRHSKRR